MKNNIEDYYEYSGVIHIHTVHSADGSGGTIEQLKNALKATEPDFCIITDHNSMQFGAAHGEQISGNCTILCGEEITPPNDMHHLLALDIQTKIDAVNEPQPNIDRVNEQNGISVICHPNIPKTLFIFKDMSWADWNVENFTGIELWSYMLDWTKEINIMNMILYMLFPHWVVKDPDIELIHRWEEINYKRKCPCFGCIDAHIIKLIPFGFNKVFTYDFLFKTIRTNIITSNKLTGNIDENRKIIYSALRAGSSFMVNYEVCDKKGFRFFAVINKKKYSIGDTAALDGGSVTFTVHTPIICEIRLIRNGENIATTIDSELDYICSKPGNYRVETIYSRRKWIISNFIYLK